MATQVHLCRMLSFRLGPGFDTLVSDLKSAGAEVGVAGCLGACLDCGQKVLARVDGTPVATTTPAELVDQVRSISQG